MNVVFFTRRFWPDIGGVEKHVLEISKRLVAKGHTVTIVTESKDLTQKKFPLKEIRILRIPTYAKRNKKFFIWKWLWKQRAVVQKADVIHCHDVFYWYLPFRFLFPFKPVFTTFHGYESYPIKKKAIFVRKISELLSFGNLCIGEFIAKWYKTRPTYVSYGAVELPEEEKSQKTKKESAVFVGRLDEQTGIRTYVDAFELLKKKFPRFELLVVGDGKQKQTIAGKAKVIGFQKNPERYFSHYHFAFVSRYLSILEAMAAKKLVVAVYDNPVKEDYLKMAPFAKFILIAKDASELVRKVQFILDHPQLEKQMITDAYAFVKQQTWENLTNLYLKLWKKDDKRELLQKKKNISGIAMVFVASFLFLSCLLYGINFPYVGPNATTANGFSLIAHNFNHYGYLQTKLAPVISITPYLLKQPIYYFHHPVLLSFTESLFFRVFGEGFWVGRLVVILFTTGSFALIYLIGKEAFNKQYASIALVIASLIPGFSIFGKLIDHEPLVLFYCLLSLYSLLKYFHENKKHYLFLTFGATALAIMSDWPAIYFLPCFFILFIKYRKINLLTFLSIFSFALVGMILTNIYITKPSDFFELWEPVQHSNLNHLLTIPSWPIRFFLATFFRAFVYLGPLLLIFTCITMYSLVRKIIKRQLTDVDLLTCGFGIFGVFHILLYSYASFTHPYLIYYLIPFIIFSSAIFLQKYFNKKSIIFLIVIFSFCFVYLLTIQIYKNKQILADLWRYELVVAVDKYLTPYEEVPVNGLSALNSDTFWRYSVITRSNDKVMLLDTHKYNHYVHSCPHVCKPDDIQLFLLKKNYQYVHFVNSGGEAYVFFLQQKQDSHRKISSDIILSSNQSEAKESKIDTTVRDIYRKIRDALHVPQF